MKTYRMILSSLTLSLAAVMATSCTSTSQMRSTKATGFLGDYASLRKGEGSEAQMVYIKPGVNWRGYNKIIIDPITAYAIPGNPLAKLPKDQLNALVGYLYSALREQLGKDYQIVNAPGPGVLRLRVALTEAGAGKPVLGVMSSLTPPSIAVSALKTAITGSGTGTGSARVEMEMLDSQTRQRLAAGVDAQSGNKRDFFGNFNKWDDAQDAFDNWAAKLQSRLMELRAGGK
jgi:hypothetical protein